MEKIFRLFAGNVKLERVSRRYYENGTVAFKFSFEDPETGGIITKTLYIHGVGTGFDGKIEKKFFFPKSKKTKKGGV